MRLRSRGLATVAMATTMLALEAIGILGMAWAIAWWESPKPVVLARAGATVWRALAGTGSRALVSAAMRPTLAVLRTADRLERAAAAMTPGGQEDPSRSVVAAMVHGRAVWVAPAVNARVLLAGNRSCRREVGRHRLVDARTCQKMRVIIQREVLAPRARPTS